MHPQTYYYYVDVKRTYKKEINALLSTINAILLLLYENA